MPRIRSIKPDFFTSDTVSTLPLRARLTWIGLWTHCDDYGRCRDNVKLIKAAIWPLDDISIRDVETDLNTLADRRLVYRYVVAGKNYLQVTNWTEHQRVSHPAGSSNPAPPEGSGALPEEFQRAPEEFVQEQGAGSGERGAGSRETPSSDTASPRSDIEYTRSDVQRLCTHLADRIEDNGSKRPTVTRRWLDAARLMLDRDEHPEQHIHTCIDWCQDDEFWRSNILSMPKLRDKYDQMRLRAQSPNGRHNPTQSTSDQRVAGTLQLAEKYREAGQ